MNQMLSYREYDLLNVGEAIVVAVQGAGRPTSMETG
jgi:hypothetical protein